MVDAMAATASGTFFVAETPQAIRGAGGAFAVTVRALDPVGMRGRESWLHTYPGADAERWWQQEGHTVRPGDGLAIVATDIRAHNRGRVPEIHARATECRIVSRAGARASACTP